MAQLGQRASWLSLGAIGIVLGWLVIDHTLGDLMEKRPEVVLIGALVVFAIAVYLLTRPSFERAVIAMVLTLPLLSVLVFDVGGSIRITYLVTLIAASIGLMQRRLAFSSRGWTNLLLLGFVGYALVSTSYTLKVPDLTAVTSSGFRGLPIRSVIQFVQLTLMVTVFYIIVSYANSRERLAKLPNMIFWSMMVAASYGLYELLAALFDIHFVDLITVNLYGEEHQILSRHFAGIDLPRPRSTFVEPLDFASFLLFCLPFAALAVALARKRLHRNLKYLCIFATLVVFVTANSRAGFLAAAMVMPFLLLFAPSSKLKIQLVGAGVGIVLILSFIIFPLVGATPGFSVPLQYFRESYQSVLSMSGRAGSYDQPLEVFRDHPMLGVGIGNYPFYLSREGAPMSDTVGTAGSIYTRLLSEVGVIGTALFLGFIASISLGLLRVLLQSRDRQLRYFGFAALIAIAMLMITRVASDGIYTESYLWVAWAIGAAVVRLHNQQRLATGAETPNPGQAPPPASSDQ